MDHIRSGQITNHDVMSETKDMRDERHEGERIANICSLSTLQKSAANAHAEELVKPGVPDPVVVTGAAVVSAYDARPTISGHVLE